MQIPFNKPYIIGKELYYIAKAVFSGHIAGDGIYTKLCNEWMEKHFNAKKVMLTTSCTHALEMAAFLMNIKDGDEIILPSYTFVTTANAFVIRGARPVFVDIRPDTLNIDETKIEKYITEKTKAIIPVHYAGVPCEMDTIIRIAKKHNCMVVEDAAQGVGSTYKGKFLGTIGEIGCYSFHETKNYICGEGGAIVINENELIERAEIIREKGTNRSKFFRGQVDKYTWVDLGSSYLPSEIVAAFLFAQLEEHETITKKRKAVCEYYTEKLSNFNKKGYFRIPDYSIVQDHNAHMFYIILNSLSERNELISYLKDKKIQTVFHYVPLHSSPMGQKFGYSEGDLPITEKISDSLLRLPLYYEITKNEQDFVINSIYEFFTKK